MEDMESRVESQGCPAGASRAVGLGKGVMMGEKRMSGADLLEIVTEVARGERPESHLENHGISFAPMADDNDATGLLLSDVDRLLDFEGALA